MKSKKCIKKFVLVWVLVFIVGGTLISCSHEDSEKGLKPEKTNTMAFTKKSTLDEPKRTDVPASNIEVTPTLHSTSEKAVKVVKTPTQYKDEVEIVSSDYIKLKMLSEVYKDEYLKKKPGAYVRISFKNGNEVLKGMEELKSKIAFVASTAEDKKSFTNMKENIVGFDACSIIVNPMNSVTNLSLEQIREIYNGKIRNWSEVGGEDAPINVYTQFVPEGKKEKPEAEGVFTGVIGKYKIDDRQIPLENDTDILSKVAEDMNSIGYILHKNVDFSVTELTINGIEANEENLKLGKYPLAITCRLLTGKDLNPVEDEFVNIVLSKEGKDMAKKHFITLD